jgi:excisionase family DNA binding protein
MNITFTSSDVPAGEINALNDLRASLPERSKLGRVLSAMSDGLRDGVGITVARDDDELTPARAATILGVSRTHLHKILDAGLLPLHTVGERDRRIVMADVRKFQKSSRSFRAVDAVSIVKRQQWEDNLLNSME